MALLESSSSHAVDATLVRICLFRTCSGPSFASVKAGRRCACRSRGAWERAAVASTASERAAGIKKHGKLAQPVSCKSRRAFSTSARPSAIVRSPIGYLFKIDELPEQPRRRRGRGDDAVQQERDRDQQLEPMAPRGAPAPA